MQYNEMSKEQLLQLKAELDERYKEAKAKGLNLNMSRGKPSATQLNVTMDMLDVINSSSDLKSEDGTDCRNYGVLDGIPEAKKLMADMMGTTPEHVIILVMQVLILCMIRYQERIHTVFLEIHLGASLIK